MSDAQQDTTVSKIRANWKELRALQARQHATMAELIRGCVTTLRADGTNTRAVRQAVTQLERSKALKEHKENQAKALLYLEWLATQLENDASETLTETPDPTEGD